MYVPNLKRIALFVQKLLGDVRPKSNEIANFHTPVYLTPPMMGLPLEFGIGVRGPECLYDGAIRWSKKFSDTFSRFDTIPAVTDSQPAPHPASHVAVAITLNAKASSLKITGEYSLCLRSELKHCIIKKYIIFRTKTNKEHHIFAPTDLVRSSPNFAW